MESSAPQKNRSLGFFKAGGRDYKVTSFTLIWYLSGATEDYTLRI